MVLRIKKITYYNKHTKTYSKSSATVRPNATATHTAMTNQFDHLFQKLVSGGHFIFEKALKCRLYSFLIMALYGDGKPVIKNAPISCPGGQVQFLYRFPINPLLRTH